MTAFEPLITLILGFVAGWIWCDDYNKRKRNGKKVGILKNEKEAD